jgi:NADH-quinone oxidoreductase subunit N
MLAYSAIAHAGYVLVAVAAGPNSGTAATLFYVLAYALMNLGAFNVLTALGPVGPDGRDATSLDDLAGLGRRHPGLALAMSVCLVSLTGLPPTIGFLAKWYVFRAAVGADLTVLAVAIVLNSVLSAFYYLRPIVYMYAGQPADTAEIEVGTADAVAVAVTAMLVALGLLVSNPMISGATRAGAVGPTAASAPTLDGRPENVFWFTAPEYDPANR